jgi:hypothetical protein
MTSANPADGETMPCALISADLEICKGKTFEQVFAWESDQVVYKPITGITKAAPPVITCVGHGLVLNWRGAIASVKTMTQINALNSPPKAKDYHVVTPIGADAFSIPINALSFGTYGGSGTLIYNAPVDLDGFTARMSIKDKVTPSSGQTANLWTASTVIAEGKYVVIADGTILEATTGGTTDTTEPTAAGTDGTVVWAVAESFSGSTELLRLTTENDGIALDNTYKTITVTITAAATAALDFRKGVYDLEMVSGDATPVVTALAAGKILVSEEVTT